MPLEEAVVVIKDFYRRLQPDLADCTDTLRGRHFHLYDLPGIPPQFYSFPGIPPWTPTKPTTASK
jgi:hypothetical protein